MTINDENVLEHKRVRAVYDAIQNSHPLTPTIRELMDATGITSSSMVRYYLQKLDKAELIERVPNVARGIILLTNKNAAPQ